MTSACENSPAVIDFEIFARDIQFTPAAEVKLKLVARAINQAALQAHEVVASILDQQTNFVYTQGFKDQLKTLGWKKANLMPLENHLNQELRLCIQTPHRVTQLYLNGQTYSLPINV